MTHRCIKPQCPTDCSECSHALPEEDEAAMLVCDLLDAFAVDGFDGPLEDGESQLVDRARAWLATRRSATLPEMPTCTKSQTPIDDEKMRDITSVLIEGLNTDGSEHKQLALEQALEMLVPDEFAECKASWQWDSGR